MVETLLPLIRKEEMNKTSYAKRLRDILSSHLNFLLEKQFKEINKKQEFLEGYIYKNSQKS